jgi:hypothetical protein
MQLESPKYVHISKGSTDPQQGQGVLDVSQQDFFSGSRSQQEGQQPFDNNEIVDAAQPYYWSTQPSKRGVPKEAPVEDPDEPMLYNDYADDYQHGYVARTANRDSYAQASVPIVNGPRVQSQSASSKKQQFSPDGDAFERQYRRYGNNVQWNVPFWARPQRQPRGPARLILFIILGVILIGPLLHVLGALLVVAAVVGVILLTLLFPFLLVGLFFIPYILYRWSRRRSYFQKPRRGRWG